MTPALPNASATRNVVFLSHAGADTHAARELKNALKACGLSVWFDEESLRPGIPWLDEIEGAISDAAGLVVYIGQYPVQGWVAREVRAALERNTRSGGSFFLIPVLGKDAAGPERLPVFLRQHQCVDLRNDVQAPENIRKLVQEIKKNLIPPRPAIPSEYWAEESPFFDLRPFEDADSWLFFGRDEEIEALLKKTGVSPVVVVAGDSGSGKSSLVRAGLVPALRRGRCRSGGVQLNDWRIALFRPANAPFEKLAAALVGLNETIPAAERPVCVCEWSKGLSDGSLNVGRILSTFVRDDETRRAARFLLVVDQLEELFTLTDNKDLRHAYIRTLARAAGLESDPPVHVIFVVRADFLHCLVDEVDLNRTLSIVPRMNSAQLGDVIRTRLALAGSSADPGFIETLLDEAGEQPGALPLLEHALQQLWERRGANNELSATVYAELGRLRGALSRYADEIYAGLDGDDEREIARRVFVELVRPGRDSPDTRRRVPKRDLLALRTEPGAVERVLGKLASGRLIATDSETYPGQEDAIELAHDALIGGWSRLRQWVDQDREDLRLRDRLYIAQDDWKQCGAVLPRAMVPQADDWLSRHPRSDLRSFIEVSRNSWQQQDWRATRNLRRWVAALAICLAVAIAGFLLAWSERRMAASRQLAAQSEQTLGADVARSLKLAVEAYETQATEEAEAALSKAMAQPMPRLVLHNGGDPNRAAWSPDGGRFLTWGNDGAARVWAADTGTPTAVLVHASSITAAAFSPDSTRVLTAGTDGVGRMWNAADGRLLKTLESSNSTPEKGSSPLMDARFSPDGRFVVTAAQDGRACLFDAETGRCRREMPIREGSLRLAAFSGDGRQIVTVGLDGRARTFSADTGRSRGTFGVQRGAASAFATSPDGREIAIGRSDGNLDIWDIETGRELSTVTAHPGSITRAQFAPDGTRIVTLGINGGARLWEVETGRAVCSINGHEGVVLDLAFSPDATRVATAGEDGSVRLWSSDTCKTMAALTGHTEQVRSVVWSPEGSRLLTVGADGTARVWDAEPASMLAVLRGHTNYVWWAAYSRDGRKLVTTGADRTARIWNAGTGALLKTLQSHGGPVTQAQFRPDGKWVATAGEDGMVRLWDVNSGNLIASLSADTDPVKELAFSPDGKQLLTLATNGSVHLWDTSTESSITAIDGTADPVVAVQFSTGGGFIALTSGGKVLNGQRAGDRVLDKRGSPVEYARWSTDRRRVMAVRAGVVQVYDSRLHLVTELPGLGIGVPLAGFSPDGDRVVVARSRRAALWTFGAKGLTTTALAHEAPILFIAFSPDGRRVVTTSEDRTARTWDSGTGRMLTVFWGHAANVERAAFSPDSRRVATASSDNTVRIYASSTDELVSTAKRRMAAANSIWKASDRQ